MLRVVDDFATKASLTAKDEYLQSNLLIIIYFFTGGNFCKDYDLCLSLEISCWNSFTLLSLLFTPLEFFPSVLADGFSLEFEWQQVSSSLQDSSQYSGRSP